MSDVQALRSYLVGLGFNVDKTGLQQFKSAFNEAAKTVEIGTLGIAGDVLKWQGIVTGAFLGIGTAVVVAADKVAMSDQNFRLMGERMFMDTKHARGLSMALDALGVSLEDVAFDPELNARFKTLQADQRNMAPGLGDDYENTMKQIRDIRFEFTRFQQELQFGVMEVVSDVFKGLGFGSGDFVKKLQEINAYIQANLPKWSAEFATYLVPILKDTWVIMKGLVEIVGDLANDFTNFIAILSGDDSLESASFSFEKFAGAVDKVAKFIAFLVIQLEKLERHTALLEILGGAAAGATVGSIIPGVGTAIGGVVGALGGTGVAMMSAYGKQHAQGDAGAGNTATAQADDARGIAASVSAQTGIPADLVYGQMAHETGNFTNRGSKDLHNYSGIRLPGSTEYRKFDSDQEYANYFSKLLTSKRYTDKGILNAKDADSYAASLKAGGYMEDTASNYARGLKNYQQAYSSPAGGGGTTINVGDIHVPQGNNVDAATVGRVVGEHIKTAMGKQNQRSLAELTTVGQ
jgi:hypothetical protein